MSHLYFVFPAFASHTSFLENNTALFGRHRNRLSVVQELKEKARLDMLGSNDRFLGRINCVLLNKCRASIEFEQICFSVHISYYELCPKCKALAQYHKLGQKHSDASLNSNLFRVASSCRTWGNVVFMPVCSIFNVCVCVCVQTRTDQTVPTLNSTRRPAV